MLPHVASRPLIGSKPNLAGLVTSITLSFTPNVKSIEIKLCLWRKVEVSCFSTTTADAINTAKSPSGLPPVIIKIRTKCRRKLPTTKVAQHIRIYTSIHEYTRVQYSVYAPVRTSEQVHRESHKYFSHHHLCLTLGKCHVQT